MKRCMQYILVIISILSCILLSISCKSNHVAQGETLSVSLPAEYAKKVIGFSVDNAALPYNKVLIDFAKWEASRQSVIVIALDAQSDAKRQNDQILDLVEMGVDALCVIPVNYDHISSSLKATKEASIPIIGVSSPKSNVNDAHYDCYVGASMFEEGVMAAKSAKSLLGEDDSNILILQGPIENSQSTQRTDGFLMELKGNPHIKILQQLNSHLNKLDAQSRMREFLLNSTKFDLVFAVDDMLALGAIEAMKAAGIGGEFPVISIGGSADGLESIKSGEIYCTVYQPPDWEGIMSISAAMKLINKEKCDKWIKTPVSIVNKENITEYKGLW